MATKPPTRFLCAMASIAEITPRYPSGIVNQTAKWSLDPSRTPWISLTLKWWSKQQVMRMSCTKKLCILVHQVNPRFLWSLADCNHGGSPSLPKKIVPNWSLESDSIQIFFFTLDVQPNHECHVDAWKKCKWFRPYSWRSMLFFRLVRLLMVIWGLISTWLDVDSKLNLHA